MRSEQDANGSNPIRFKGSSKPAKTELVHPVEQPAPRPDFLTGKRFFLIPSLSFLCFSLLERKKKPSKWKGSSLPKSLWEMFSVRNSNSYALWFPWWKSRRQVASHLKIQFVQQRSVPSWEEEREERGVWDLTLILKQSSVITNKCCWQEMGGKDKVNISSLPELIRHFTTHPNFISCFKLSSMLLNNSRPEEWIGRRLQIWSLRRNLLHPCHRDMMSLVNFP